MRFELILGFLLLIQPQTADTRCQKTKRCPEDCVCTELVGPGPGNGGISITCEKYLEQIPDIIPLDVVEFHAGKNYVEKIRTTDFEHCSNLTVLDLSMNEIRFIEANAFSDLQSLKQLRLFHNSLSYNISFPPDIFLPLSRLESLEMYDQQMSSKAFKLSDFGVVMSTLSISVKSLHIDIPCNNSFTPVLQRLTGLAELGLHRINRCQSVIGNDTFKPLASLPITKLKIQFANLTKVEPLAFSWFKNLTSLDLSETRGMSVYDLHPAWVGLKLTNISNLRLSSFRRYVDDDVTLFDAFFDQFDLDKLRYLHLDGTNLRGVSSQHWKLPEKVKNLEYLNLAHNRMDLADITMLTYLLTEMEHLRDLDLSFQSTTKTRTLVIDIPPILTTLNISALTPCSRKEDAQYVHSITLFSPNNLTRFEFRNNCMLSLGILNVSHPNPNTPFTLDLSHNMLDTLLTPWVRLMYGDTVEYDFIDDSLSNGLRLVGLQLSHNSFGRSWQKYAEEKSVFGNYSDLKELDLSSNGINSLPESVFVNFTKLEVLNLSFNNLDSIKFQFSHMTSLRKIDLSNNNLMHLNWAARNNLNMLQQSSLTLDLKGNNLEWSCDTLPSLQWMSTHRFMFPNIARYSGSYENRRISFSNFSTLLSQLESLCMPQDINQLFNQLEYACKPANVTNIISALGAHYHNLSAAVKSDCKPNQYDDASPIKQISSRLGAGLWVALFIGLIIYACFHNGCVKYIYEYFNPKEEIVDTKLRSTYEVLVFYHENDHEWVQNSLIGTLGDTPKYTPIKKFPERNYPFLPDPTFRYAIWRISIRCSLEEKLSDSMADLTLVIMFVHSSDFEKGFEKGESKFGLLNATTESSDKVLHHVVVVVDKREASEKGADNRKVSKEGDDIRKASEEGDDIRKVSEGENNRTASEEGDDIRKASEEGDDIRKASEGENNRTASEEGDDIRKVSEEGDDIRKASEGENNRTASEEGDDIRKASEKGDDNCKASEEGDDIRKASEKGDDNRKASKEGDNIRKASEEGEDNRKASEEGGKPRIFDQPEDSIIRIDWSGENFWESLRGKLITLEDKTSGVGTGYEAPSGTVASEPPVESNGDEKPSTTDERDIELGTLSSSPNGGAYDNQGFVLEDADSSSKEETSSV